MATMPTAPVTLDISAFATWLRNALTRAGTVDVECPACKQRLFTRPKGEPGWTLLPNVLAIREFPSLSIRAKGNNEMPLAALACQRCGHVMLFSAMIAGLVSEDSADGEHD